MRGNDGKFVSQYGYYHHELYQVWEGMLKRCYNPKAVNYERYGARGISVCQEWRNDFCSFREWSIENGWQKGLQLDRIDNKKGYSPENCRFSTAKEQANNRRSNVVITYRGKTQTLKMWAEEIGLRYETVHKRIAKLKWSIEKALETPTRNHKPYKNSGGTNNDV